MSMADVAIYRSRRSGTRRANLKKSLFIALALLVLPFSLVISSGTANAAIETEKSLSARLLTDAELKAALAANGVTLNFDGAGIDLRDSDINLPDMVASGRIWSTTDNSGFADVLVSYKDGRAIPADMRDGVLKGDMARGFLEGLYKNLAYKGQLEDKDLGPNEAVQGFEGTDPNGNVDRIAVVSFVRGNIFGMVLYATADNQLVEALSAFGGQLAKLPN